MQPFRVNALWSRDRTLICPLQRPEKSIMLYQPRMYGMPDSSTLRSIAQNPITASSIGAGSSRHLGASLSAALRQTFNMNRFSS